jgi:biotin transport system substrate-specific component
MKVRPVPFLLVLLMVALLAPFSFNLPLTEIPITAQTLVLFLGAVLLSPFEAVLMVLLYLLLGAIGLPVFADFSSGYQKLFGTTAGFLWAFAPAVWFLSIKMYNKRVPFVRALLLFLLAHVFVLIIGGLWMLRQSNATDVFFLIAFKLLPVALFKSFLLALFTGAISFVKKV